MNEIHEDEELPFGQCPFLADIAQFPSFWQIVFAGCVFREHFFDYSAFDQITFGF